MLIAPMRGEMTVMGAKELRTAAQGDDAVRHLVDDAVPMFEFAVRTTIGRFDLSTAEGRVQGMRAAAPIVARDTLTKSSRGRKAWA